MLIEPLYNDTNRIVMPLLPKFIYFMLAMMERGIFYTWKNWHENRSNYVEQYASYFAYSIYRV